MGIHKLTAGSGYDYLTRQVAALDATEKGHVGLASYYSERGETPGEWIGSGLEGIDGLDAGDVVTAEQMQALFGSGHHPLAKQRLAALCGPDLTDENIQAATRLGNPYRVYDHDFSPFHIEVAKRIAVANATPDAHEDDAEQRARIRTEVATEFFHAEHGRPPTDARELAATIATHSRPKTTAVAGYDLTFSPVKSVSALWAVAPPEVAAGIERAHRAAIHDALTFIERHALYTRTGTDGVRQVDVRGLLATAFTHRDSRAGDPDLHTHVAVANKVQTLDGRWLSIDGRVLFKATVAASETYNTSLEHYLYDALGLRFAERPNADVRTRPVREILGVDPCLNERWSARRADIEVRRSELATQFQDDHGRPPSPVESLHLAQQATLETRAPKHEPRRLSQQRTTWRQEAIDVLGTPEALQAMVARVLTPQRQHTAYADRTWIARTAADIIDTVEQRRSTWQTWHVRAEAQRRIRAANITSPDTDELVNRLVHEALTTRSISLARPGDGVEEPAALRRTDGSSVYTVAGADLYTSTAVLAAERRLVTTAGRTDGRVARTSCVDLALLEATANGTTLNAGQAALVRGMATSGARLQVAIAPAGAGKTTAMAALTSAWTDDGGTVIGLAPSAAAAAVLRDQIGATTDTLAKLTFGLDTGTLPDWAVDIEEKTLVVIDEAGMADTLTLDAVVAYVVSRGGSVRLIGDDQQLAAIGAGGVLRDIEATHGALQLTQLMRFTDPAEAAASLALRDGRPEALGFYLDTGRVHVGDLATMTDAVLNAWRTDRANGLDAIMLAPTRDLVAELNQRARADRVGDDRPTRTLTLADGNDASVGDVVITRTNDRRLRISATDWVKNGDRWVIRAIGRDDSLTVAHARTGRIVRLPADYVAHATDLGYATTIHTAQGVTADTMHGVSTGEESRQQLYTMLTRGARANHLYLQVVGDGDPHGVIRPETVHPRTATDILERMLARDDSPRSATTLQRDAHDPAVRLGEATARYVDSLYAAAEAHLGPPRVASLDREAGRVVPGVTDEPAWLALRAHLLLLAAAGHDPSLALERAAAARDLGDADDVAAVLDWRLDDTGHRGTGPGPLPWLPGIPDALRAEHAWGTYLLGRAQLVRELAHAVHENATRAPARPAWARHTGRHPDEATVAAVAVWRAATRTPESDLRPTGTGQLQKAAALWQRELDDTVNGHQTPALQEWGPLIHHVATGTRGDDFTPVLADRLAAVSRAGIDAAGLLRSAITAGPLPDDHAAAALWWRVHRRLSPAVADTTGADLLVTDWTPQLLERLGPELVAEYQDSPAWPALVATVDDAVRRGWPLESLVGEAPEVDGDDCQALVWRIAVLLDSISDEHAGEPYDDRYLPPPEDMHEGAPPPRRGEAALDGAPPEASWPPSGAREDPDDDYEIVPTPEYLAVLRDLATPPEPSDADIERMVRRAIEWDDCPATRERMLAVNEATQVYFAGLFPTSWARGYLAERFWSDVTGNPDVQPGYAPAGWDHLVRHLHRRGFTDEEMLAAGVASKARTGRLIDRFRDRVVVPIVHNGEILGFVGRRNPATDGLESAGAKYLNTPDTPLFHKGAQLYVVGAGLLADGATPVLVEGPMDAIAVTLTGDGMYAGVAPLGTSLTSEQAAQLGRIGRGPIIATDADLPGQAAAERAYWALTEQLLDPLHIHLDEGLDPARVLAQYGTQALSDALASASSLADAHIGTGSPRHPQATARKTTHVAITTTSAKGISRR